MPPEAEPLPHRVRQTAPEAGKRCGTRQWEGQRMTNPPRTGKFLWTPYDWRRPTVARIKSRWWNPDEPRLFTAKAFGWGWDINLARLLRRKRLADRVVRSDALAGIEPAEGSCQAVGLAGLLVIA